MTKKHNVKKAGSGSNYKERLQDRGLVKTPRMTDMRLSDGKPASAKR